MDKSKIFPRRVFINDIDSYASENIAKVSGGSWVSTGSALGLFTGGTVAGHCVSTVSCAVLVRVHGGVTGPRRRRDRRGG